MTRRACAVATTLALVLVALTACSSPPPAPTVTVTATQRAEPDDRSPGDALTNLEAHALCEAQTQEASTLGPLPIEREYDLSQVVQRNDGDWFVIIDEFDPNADEGDYNPDGIRWSWCILGGTVGKVTWKIMDTDIQPPPSDPNDVEGVDYDLYGHD